MEKRPEVRTATLSREDWAIIGQALVEIPYRVAAPVLQRLDQQLNPIEGEDEGATTTPGNSTKKARTGRLALSD